MTILSTVTPTTAYLGDTVTLTAEVSETISSSHIAMWIIDFDETTDSSTTLWELTNQEDKVLNYEWSPFASETDMSSEIQVDESILGTHTLTFILAQDDSMGISISSYPELFTIGDPINVSFKMHLYDKVKKLGNQWFYLKDEVNTLLSAKAESIHGHGIEETDLLNVLDCVNTNFDNFSGYIFYDACDSATTLSNYESSISLRNSGSSAMTQNGTKHQLTVTNTGQSFIEIPALEGVTDSFKMIIHSQSSSNRYYCGIGLCLYIDANNWYSVEDTSEKIWTYQKVNGTFSYTEGSATTNYIGAELVQECIYDSQTHKITLNRYDSNMVFIESQELSVPSTITNPHWGVGTDWYKDVYVLLEKIKVESL